MGLSLRWVAVCWLTHILSQAAHRLSYLDPWAEQRLHTLRRGSEQLVHPLDVSNNRLARLRAVWSDDDHWRAFEGDVNRQLLHVYDLRPARGHLDSTTASGYGTVTADGLF
jgi:hypothetical protein